MKGLYAKLSCAFRVCENFLLVGSLLSIIALTVLQIFLRNAFSYSISWIEPLNQHLVLLIAFAGAMVAGRNSEHILFDPIQHYLPARIKRVFNLFAGIFSASICFALAALCAKLTYADYLDPLPAFARVPQWVFELIIPLGFFVMGYRLLKASFLQMFFPDNLADNLTDKSPVTPS